MQIADRVSLWGGKKSPLPPGARWVEYLESTGTQYIDMSSTLGNVDIVPTIKWCPLSSTNDRWIFGGGQNSTPQYSRIGVYTTGTSFTLPNSATSVHVRIQSKSTLYPDSIIDIVQQQYVTCTFPFTIKDANIFLFAQEWGGAVNGKMQARVFWAKIRTADNRLIHDFAPIAIGTTGYLLDLVSGEYLPYGNKGTGEFIVGPDAPAMTGGGISAYA